MPSRPPGLAPPHRIAAPFPRLQSAGTSGCCFNRHLGDGRDFICLVVNGKINIIYTKTLLHLPRCWDNLNPMIALKGQASVIRALPGVVASVFSSGQVPKLRPIIIEVVVPSPA